MLKIIPVILSGGVGSRLWPLSREQHPKQFIRLADNQSLIQKTYARALSIPGIEEIITMTNRDLFFYTKDEYSETDIGQDIHVTYILEPFGRNTAPAIATATLYAAQKYGDDAILVILPADHLILNPDSFIHAVEMAIQQAENNKLVTFGIKPNAAKTGYGYIEADGNKVLQFVEKPNKETAQNYLASGNFFWNAGIFCFAANIMLQQMQMYCPDILCNTKNCLTQALTSECLSWSQVELNPALFKKIEDISIDYAVFEKSHCVAIIPCDIGWSDIGSWIEFGELSPSDEYGNCIQGEAVLDNVKNCIVYSENRLVAGIDLENLIIADTTDALLIADRNNVQDVKHIVKKLKSTNHDAYKMHPTVHRPWGTYTVLQHGAGFKIKRIEIKPGASISLQMHYYRSEHWVIVSGKAKVINGEKEVFLQANESIYIPVGNKHRLENPEQSLLVLIEVQCGEYLGEDDIVRFEDAFGRVDSAQDQKESV